MQDVEQITNFSVVRAGYESTMRQFYEKLKAERETRIGKTGDANWTEEEALLPWLVSFLLPGSKCRAVMEYDPVADRVKFFHEEECGK